MTGQDDPVAGGDRSGFEPEIIAALEDRWSKRRFPAGSVILREGEPSPGLALVRQGWVRVYRSSLDGRELVLRFIGPDELWNGAGLMAGQLNPASAVALEDCDVWFLPVEEFHQALAERPDLALRIIHNLVHQIRQMADQMAELSLFPVSVRLARWLLDEAHNDLVERPRWFTQAQLAARLGTVPDVTQRALGDLVRERLVEVERHEFRIIDRAGLEARARNPT